MPERVYTTEDKSTWERGPWDDEPDKVSWTDENTGLPCLIKRGSMGSLCGYVAVAEGHPYYEQRYQDIALDSVHGGLTYSDFCQENAPEAEGICHVPEPGQPDRVWWLGFDCGHAYDISPAFEARNREIDTIWPTRFGGESYKGIDYVRREVLKLARQLAAVAGLR